MPWAPYLHRWPVPDATPDNLKEMEVFLALPGCTLPPYSLIIQRRGDQKPTTDPDASLEVELLISISLWDNLVN